jgi:hypothetical protein
MCVVVLGVVVLGVAVGCVMLYIMVILICGLLVVVFIVGVSVLCIFAAVQDLYFRPYRKHCQGFFMQKHRITGLVGGVCDGSIG